MIRLLLLALALLGPAAARAETLITSLSTHRVAITSNYVGATIVVFGAIERDGQSISRGDGYDIVVTVSGPRQTLTVREKGAVGPAWINLEQQKFAAVPAYLGVYSSAPLDEITTPALIQRFRVGVAAAVNSPDMTPMRGTDDPFREALVRLKTQEGLYLEDERGVTFLTPTLFRSAAFIPATAPPGPYEVDVKLFSGGVLLARTQTSFELVKTGFEQQMAGLARNWSWLYGLATAGAALLFGWLASVVFRRD